MRTAEETQSHGLGRLEDGAGLVAQLGYMVMDHEHLRSNQVECWFSILSRHALRGASFTSPQQLRKAIDDFVAVYNEKAAPFEWKKAVVFPSGPKQKYSDLCN